MKKALDDRFAGSSLVDEREVWMATLFTNGTVIDGLGGIREGIDVVVEGERIVTVGTAGSTAQRNFDQVYDLQGLSLLPGLIDTHLHFAGGDYDPINARDSVGLAALRSAEAAQRSLLAGFTSIRSGSP